MGTKKGKFPKSVIRKLMKEAGAALVSKDAVEFMGSLIEGYIKSTTGKALIFMEHAKRKTLTPRDLELTQLKP